MTRTQATTPFRRRCGFAVVALALLAGCDSTEPLPRAVYVDFAAVPDTLGVGDSVHLTAHAVADAGDELPAATLSWTSRNPQVVDVTTSGEARARAIGDALLVATVRGRARGIDSVRVHVTPASRSLHFALAHDSVTVNDTLTADVSVDARYGPAVESSRLRFSSSDTLIARVDSISGRVSMRGDGDVTIRATDGQRTTTTVLHSYLQTIETGGVRLREISIGWGFGCGLDADGAAYCWGANRDGQLGRGTRATGDAMLAFGPVSTNARFSALSAGRGGACGITRAGGVECWGTRALSGLRQSLTLDQQTVPVPIALPQGAGRIVRVDVGTRGPLCAIDEAGANYCFGDNTYNGIGGNAAPGDPFRSAFVSTLRPVPGSPDTGLQSIGTGEMHGCGTTTAGALWCWGYGWSWGATTTTTDAVRVAGVPPFHDVVAGYMSTCALAPDGTPWCGGYFESSNTASPLRALARPPGAAPLARLEGGTEHVCGLATNGEAWCWSSELPLFAPYEFFASQPVPLSRRERFIDVGASMSGLCGVTGEGMVRCLSFQQRFQ